MQRGALTTPEELLAGYTSLKPVKRTPLRVAYAGATLSALLALLPTEPALGHVDVRPRLVEQGKEAVLRVELPQLRAGPAPERLEVEGDGIEVLSTRLQGMAGPETVWSVRVRTDAAAGRLLLILRAVYANGASVEVDDTLTVVPPSETSSFPWIVVVAGVLLALALALVSLRVVRRKA